MICKVNDSFINHSFAVTSMQIYFFLPKIRKFNVEQRISSNRTLVNWSTACLQLNRIGALTRTITKGKPRTGECGDRYNICCCFASMAYRYMMHIHMNHSCNKCSTPQTNRFLVYVTRWIANMWFDAEIYTSDCKWFYRTRMNNIDIFFSFSFYSRSKFPCITVSLSNVLLHQT